VSSDAPSGAYPGNLSLPVEVREKILSTFRHTLDLYRDGKVDDCLIGCDFILKMDPRFAPARKLLEKAKNPKAAIDLAELQSVLPPGSPPPSPRVTGNVASPRETGGAVPPRRDTAPIQPPAASPFLSQGSEPAGTDESATRDPEELSLDSLSLDGPLPDMAANAGTHEAGLPFGAGSSDAGFPGLSQGALASDPGLAAASALSPTEEIEVLLRKGDEARSSGDKQQAIEIWSRVFLIDINNAEAVTRIEDARREMVEESRKVAAAFEKGQESLAKGDLASARSEFNSVLSVGAEPPATATPVAPVATTPLPAALPAHDLSAVAAPGDVLAEEMDQSGPPGGRRSWTSIPRPPRDSAPDAAEPAAKRLGLRIPRIPPRIALLAGAGLVVVAAALFFFLRSPGERPVPPRSESGPSLEHATQLFQEGKIDETTAELRQIPRGSPDYDRAQKLLASLDGSRESAPRPAAASEPAVAGDAAAGDPASLRADAERALAENRFIDAMKSFSLAAPHFQGDPTFSQEMAVASERVSELTPAVKLYNDGEFETAIPILWRLYQASRDNKDARSYLVRSYYNQGILQLQNGLFDKAKESFGEVLSLDPQDVESARHRQFAERYHSGELDLLGRIYVRYISPRP
jgi:tetratricopeptide (TPR) repeat protein